MSMLDYSDSKTTHQIENNLKYHAPNGDTIPRYEAIREKAREFAILINQMVPASREKSEAMTQLEDTVMWANAGVARNIK